MNQHANIDRMIWSLMTGEKTIISSYRRHIEPDLIQAAEPRAVLFWTLDHFDNHGSSPGIDEITHRVDALSGDAKDTKQKQRAARVEDYVGHLINNYMDRPLDPDRSSHVTRETLNQLRVADIQRQVDQMEERGQSARAARLLEQFEQIPPISKPFINLNGAEGYRFPRTGQSMFDMGDDLGRFFGDVIQRKRLLSLMGPEKRGKSFWLLEFAYRAFLAGYRVAIWSVGDMDEFDFRERWASRLTGRPDTDQRVSIPGGCEVDVPKTGHKTHARTVASANRKMKSWTPEEVAKEQKRIERSHKVKRPDDTLIRFYEEPMMSITAAEISSEMESASYGGWDVDVVVIDYADILAPATGKSDERAEINDTWMTLRKMSQVLNACVVTATQTDTPSYDVHTMTMKNFTGDKRKLSHVFGMIGLNQTEDEKADDAMRLNWVVRRKGKFTQTQCVHVSGCRAIGNIAMHSKL